MKRIVSVLGIVSLLAASHGVARAATYTVTNINDSGAGSLRAAIEAANAIAGPHRIVFAIPGDGPHTIQPLSPLPALIRQIAIDATTQPGYFSVPAVAGTPLIVLNGSLAGTTDAIRINAAASNSSVRGLAIVNFEGDGMYLQSANACTVAANHIGCNPAGQVAIPNQTGIFLLGGSDCVIGGSDARSRNVLSGNLYQAINAANTTGLKVQGNYMGTNASGTAALANLGGGVFFQECLRPTVGGIGEGLGNVISGNLNDGLHVRNTSAPIGVADGHRIYGNKIGTDVYGTSAIPNQLIGLVIKTQYAIVGDVAAPNIISGNGTEGVYVTDPANNVTIRNNYIGTDLHGANPLGNGTDGLSIFSSPDNDIVDNVIAANDGYGLRLQGATTTGNTARGNAIGTNQSGAAMLGNAFAGIYIDASNNLIGGSNAAHRNLVAYNNQQGIFVFQGTGNDLKLSRAYSNNLLDIDLGPAAGKTPNDPLDPDTGPNHIQNYPTITAVSYNAAMAQLEISGNISSEPNLSYDIDYYSSPACHSSGNGGGETWMGRRGFLLNPTGTVSYFHTIPSPPLSGRVITATATRYEAGTFAASTSEFSVCFTMAPTVDTGPPAATPRFEFALGPARPHPARGTVRIPFTLPSAARVTMRLYDAAGRQVATVLEDDRPAGRHEVPWRSSELAAGVYLCRLHAVIAGTGESLEDSRTVVVSR